MRPVVSPKGYSTPVDEKAGEDYTGSEECEVSGEARRNLFASIWSYHERGKD
jgi:hypothetical protein